VAKYQRSSAPGDAGVACGAGGAFWYALCRQRGGKTLRRPAATSPGRQRLRLSTSGILDMPAAAGSERAYMRMSGRRTRFQRSSIPAAFPALANNSASIPLCWLDCRNWKKRRLARARRRDEGEGGATAATRGEGVFCLARRACTRWRANGCCSASDSACLGVLVTGRRLQQRTGAQHARAVSPKYGDDGNTGTYLGLWRQHAVA